MRRWFLAVAVTLFAVVRVSADLTITMTTTIEGGMAAAAGGAPMPKIVTRIKGTKARTDIDMNGNTTSILADLTTKQMIMLRPDEKTAQIIDASAASASQPIMAMPKIETSVKPTGQKREIDGAQCAEYAITMTMDMAPMGGRADMPPEAAAMLKGLMMKMNGSAWIAKDAPGAAEYATYQASAAKVALTALAARSPSAGRGGFAGMPQGMEKLIAGFGEAPGIPYLTELTMSMEGNSQIAAMMQQMGQMKIISRVTDISTASLADTLFSVPADYKMIKP